MKKVVICLLILIMDFGLFASSNLKSYAQVAEPLDASYGSKEDQLIIEERRLRLGLATYKEIQEALKAHIKELERLIKESEGLIIQLEMLLQIEERAVAIDGLESRITTFKEKAIKLHAEMKTNEEIIKSIEEQISELTS